MSVGPPPYAPPERRSGPILRRWQQHHELTHVCSGRCRRGQLISRLPGKRLDKVGFLERDLVRAADVGDVKPLLQAGWRLDGSGLADAEESDNQVARGRRVDGWGPDCPRAPGPVDQPA